ncbi:hypothetical protein V1477_020233 [Vespula maculifrons]|uniref:Uncharacterized protein n=1 Tax=Vespula maculifrons TaxID=7453 RepID=A0ABD2ALC3_VESMC
MEIECQSPRNGILRKFLSSLVKVQRTTEPVFIKVDQISGFVVVSRSRISPLRNLIQRTTEPVFIKVDQIPSFVVVSRTRISPLRNLSLKSNKFGILRKFLSSLVKVQRTTEPVFIKVDQISGFVVVSRSRISPLCNLIQRTTEPVFIKVDQIPSFVVVSRSRISPLRNLSLKSNKLLHI